MEKMKEYPLTETNFQGLLEISEPISRR